MILVINDIQWEIVEFVQRVIWLRNFASLLAMNTLTDHLRDLDLTVSTVLWVLSYLKAGFLGYLTHVIPSLETWSVPILRDPFLKRLVNSLILKSCKSHYLRKGTK